MHNITLPATDATNGVFADPALWRAWCWCLFQAAECDRLDVVRVGQGAVEVPVTHGQFAAQRGMIGAALGVPDSTARNLMERLGIAGRITWAVSPDKQYTIVTIVSAKTYIKAKPKARTSTSPISWSQENGWAGITDADRAAWAIAYPACDVPRQLAAMGEWLKSNGAKAHKKQWRKFITGWLGRAQERGGDVASKPAGRPEAPRESLADKFARAAEDQ